MRRSAPGHKHASQQARRDEASASVTGRNRCSAANGARVPIPVMVIGEQSCCDALKPCGHKFARLRATVHWNGEARYSWPPIFR
jgi:hypothetical protein